MVMHWQQVREKVWEHALACGRQPEEIELVTVSKNQSVENLRSVYAEGGRLFGENRLQEALPKISQLPLDCEWHFIGTLQKNKVKKAIAAFQLIHSVDSLELAMKISQESQLQGKTTSLLLQVNISGELSKHGQSAEEWEKKLEALNALPCLSVEGLMTMAPDTEEAQVCRACFRGLRELRDKWKKEMKDPARFHHLSMGMSHDYLLAIEEGATLLRIGSAIFS